MNNNSLWSDALYRLTRNRAAMIGGLILVALIICAILAPWIAPYSYSYQDLNLGASPPSSDHLLGTDILGRDLLSRILYGARISLLVGFVATGVALVIGVSWGIIAGYMGGRIDSVMMRIVDVLYGLPFIIFIILLMVIFGRNLWLLFGAIGAVEWLTMARIVRGQVINSTQPLSIGTVYGLRMNLTPITPTAKTVWNEVPNTAGFEVLSGLNIGFYRAVVSDSSGCGSVLVGNNTHG